MILNKKVTWKNADKARARIRAIEESANTVGKLPDKYIKELIDLKTAYNIYKDTK